MNEKFSVLTIFGSPHDKNSNTRAFVGDFLDHGVNDRAVAPDDHRSPIEKKQQGAVGLDRESADGTSLVTLLVPSRRRLMPEHPAYMMNLSAYQISLPAVQMSLWNY